MGRQYADLHRDVFHTIACKVHVKLQAGVVMAKYGLPMQGICCVQILV